MRYKCLCMLHNVATPLATNVCVLNCVYVNVQKVSNAHAALLRRLLPLDGGGWLGGDVVGDSGDTVDLVDDSGGDLLEEAVLEWVPVGGHEVGGLDGSEGDDLLVGALVAHDTDGLDGQQAGEGLGDLVVEARVADLLDVDGVGVSGDGDLGLGDLTEDTDGETWAWEWVSPDELVGDAEQLTKVSDLVLEQLAEGLDELELHVVEQTADVVVGLDGLGWALEGDGLDDVWVQGTLEEELDLLAVLGGDAGGLALEDVDEGVADDLALLLWVGDALEVAEELGAGVDDGEVDAEAVGEDLLDVGGLVESEDTVVDEDGVESVADGLGHELGGDGGVDTAGDGADDLGGGADEVPDALDLGLDEVLHGPVLVGVTEVDGEVLEELLAVGGVGDLWVELDAVDGLGLVDDTAVRGVVGGGDGLEAVWEAVELVAVGHPDGGVVDALEERAGLVEDVEGGGAVLALLTAADLAAVDPGELLHTVADTEDRNVQVEHGWVDVGGVVGVHRVWATGENDTLGLPGELSDLLGAWEHLSVDVELSESSGDEVGVLGTEVQHQDGVEDTGDLLNWGHIEGRWGCISTYLHYSKNKRENSRGSKPARQRTIQGPSLVEFPANRHSLYTRCPWRCVNYRGRGTAEKKNANAK